MRSTLKATFLDTTWKRTLSLVTTYPMHASCSIQQSSSISSKHHTNYEDTTWSTTTCANTSKQRKMHISNATTKFMSLLPLLVCFQNFLSPSFLQFCSFISWLCPCLLPFCPFVLHYIFVCELSPFVINFLIKVTILMEESIHHL